MSESDKKNDSVGPDSDKSVKSESKKSVVIDLDFAPSWARTSPDDHLQSIKSSRFESDGGGAYNRRPGSRDGRPGGGDDRFARKERDNKKFDRKPPRRKEFETDRAQPAKTRDDSAPGAVQSAAPALSQSEGGYRERREYSSQGRGGSSGRQQQFEQHPPVQLEVRVLPEQKALGGVIRRIQSSHRAFPLRDIAWLFLDKPASCLVRLAQLKEAPVPLFQCKVCGMPALSEEEIQSHLMSRHLDDFFAVEDVECGPPGGQFVCVMRCGMTGELLGPPNHHSYNTRVQEMLRTKFPNLSEEAYRRKIESVRDTEVIETWRNSCTKKKIYRRKSVQPVLFALSESPAGAVTAAAGSEDLPSVAVDTGENSAEALDNEIKSPPMEREVAELVFKREIMPKQYSAVKHMICIASTALQTPNKGLYYAIKDMLQKERRFPTSLFFALRGAFRHRKLHLFRANESKGPDFVMQKRPSELDPSHAVALVKDILAYLHDHPACTKVELIHALSNHEESKIKETLGQLAWLIEKGNIIEFYNDVLSAPIEFPTFRLLEGEQKRGKRGESVAVEDPKAEKKSAPTAEPLPELTAETAAPAAELPETAAPAPDVPAETAAPAPELPETAAPAPELPAETAAPAPELPETAAPAPELPAETAAPAPELPETAAPAPDVPAETAAPVVKAKKAAAKPKGVAKAKAPKVKASEPEPNAAAGEASSAVEVEAEGEADALDA